MLNAISLPLLPDFSFFAFIRFHGSDILDPSRGHREDGRLAKFYPVDNSTDAR